VEVHHAPLRAAHHDLLVVVVVVVEHCALLAAQSKEVKIDKKINS